LRKLATLLVGLTVGLTGAVIGTGTASADPLVINYDAGGTTHVKKTNNDVALGPGSIVASLDVASGVLSSTLTLPTAHAKFNALGFLPTTADIDFLPQGAAIGTVGPDQITANAKVVIRIHNVWSGGLPIIVGNNCKTTPATIALTSTPGFQVFVGGDLTGTYTIPNFDNCLLASGLLNALIAGSGNTITLHLAARL
jgi:hypothetical protein